MYGRNTEHTFYSLTPKLAAKATQRIGKARSQLLRVPRRNNEISLAGLLLEIPEPNHRVQPKTQSGGTLRAFGFVGLSACGGLTAEKLFGIFECIFYRPAVCVAGQYFGRIHRHIGGEKEVVFFFAGWVSSDNQQDRLTEALQGRRDARVRQQRTDADWAQELAGLLDGRYAKAEKVILVCDNLNTHTIASFYKAFAPAEARRLAERIEIHHTPKHGSWLNIAECELSVLSRHCLRTRTSSIQSLICKVTPCARERNHRQCGVDWQFTAKDARIKLKRLYPHVQLS